MKNALMLTILVLVAGLAGIASGWNNRDIGSPSAPGSASYNGGTGKWTVTADGNDIWGHSDNFHYVYKSLMGDGKLTARVVNMSGPGTDGWAKAGVMIREDLGGGSKHALMAMTPTAGQAVAFQWRDTTGGLSNTIHSGSQTFPYWILIERSGNFFFGSHSPDGITWTLQSMSFVPMGQHAYIGLAVTSHEEGVLRRAEFDNVTIEGKIGMGTAWTYQGRLMDANQPADGIYDLRFKLYDSNDVQQGGTVDINDLDVIEGDFTTALDFGSDVFDGAARWLDISVRPGAGTGSFTTLSPRQEATPVPYALQTRGIFVDNTGNVGIGTENPQVRLSLGAELPPTLKKLAIWDGNDDFYGFGADWGAITIYAGNEEKVTIQDTGNVGIGTTSPGARLHVQYGDSGFDPTNVTGLFVENYGAGNDYYVFHPEAKLDVRGTVKLGVSGAADVLDAYPTNVYLKAPNGSINFQTPNGTNRMSIIPSGNTGIGTTNPAVKLHVFDPSLSPPSTTAAIFEGPTSALRIQPGSNIVELVSYKPGAYDPLFIRATDSSGIYLDTAGNVGIGTKSPWAMLDVNAPSGNRGILGGSWYGVYGASETGYAGHFEGKVRVKVLEITGGSDIAEPFDVKETGVIKAGMVVSIDPDNAGKLKIAKKAYDRCVAGIVSGAGGVKPGMLMTQSGSAADGEHPVALTGRSYCWVDASYGKIQPGDLLTTSDTPGHAMKVVDYTKAQGAVLGKAMTKLDRGRGLVLVLVTLQ
ncbi:MAG: hypothetical protein ACYSU5_12640 [Planctomycetota bacterium]|jgi:hypothetical protein